MPSIDIIDLDYPQWHTAQDDLDHVSARSLQIVGDVVLDALPQIERRASAALTTHLQCPTPKPSSASSLLGSWKLELGTYRA